MSERDITTLNSQLVVAVRNNEGDEVERLLSQGASPNAFDSFNGLPVLVDACERRSYSVCKLLVKRGADVNKTYSWGETALMVVACNGADEMVDFLLSSNADAGQKDMCGNTAVDYAVGGGHMSTAGRLVLATQRVEDVRVENCPVVFHWACKSKSVDIARNIIERLGAAWKDGWGRTLLHYAAHYDSRDVVEFLLANKADADASDDDGKRPYQLADGELRRRLRKAIDEQKYAVLFAEGTVRPEIIKLCFIGSEGAGKTTLMEALKRGWFKRIFRNENQADDPDCEEERTIGINVMVALIPGVGLVSLWDHAGQKQFHKTHGLFFSASNSFFILLVSLWRVKEERWCSYDELLDEVQYWLSFLRSSLDGEFIPTVLIMASRGDRDRQRDGQRVLQRVLDYIRDLFKGLINIIQECLVIDCRQSKSPEMKQLKKLLRGFKQQLEESAPLYPRLCQPVVSKLLPSLRKKQEDQFMETETLMKMIEQEACPGQEKEVVEKVVDFLDQSGEIAVVGDVAALNPVCLHQYAIGPIVASKDFKWHVKSERNDGTVTKKEAETAIDHYSRDHKIAVQLNPDKVLAINTSLGICFKVEGRDDTYMFPALLPSKDLSVMWKKDESKKVYVGRRQVCRSQTTIFSPSTFCMFQSKVCITLDQKARLWRDGLILSQCSTVHNLIECLVAMIDPVRSVDFVCRGGKQTEAECVSLLDTVMSLWRDMLDSYSPYTKYQTEYLSRKHLEEHKELKQVVTYSQKEIDEAEAKEEGAHAAVKQVVGDELMVESLVDLLVVSSRPVTGQCNVTLTADMKINVLRQLRLEEASHLRFTFQQGNMPDFKSIRDAVVKHCSSRWYEIGLTILGLNGDEIERQTHNKPHSTGKLLALIEARRTKDGGSKTAEDLLRMCYEISTPVCEEMKVEFKSKTSSS
ncbi:death-associated protein kinase 1-like isoform X2 [Corticium candelabrum]|nr:death-associated protein kinase 1-like isoform X2 [Corticium candelabrum]